MKAIVIVLTVLLASCAPAADERDAAGPLEAQANEIRAAAANRDRPGAERELAEMRSSVEGMRRSNELTDQKADEVLDALDDVARNLSLITRPTPTPLRRSPSPSPTPKPTTPPPTEEPPPPEPPKPSPTQEPQPTETPESPDDDRNSGNDGRSGVPGL